MTRRERAIDQLTKGAPYMALIIRDVESWLRRVVDEDDLPVEDALTFLFTRLDEEFG